MIPSRSIEAMTIAGWAVGATKGVIYARDEYPHARAVLAAAIEAATTAGLSGPKVRHLGVPFSIELRRGAGAYICGEETALFNSIEGHRGEPRSKPPFPVDAGLFGRPTLVHNVETLANVVRILDPDGTGAGDQAVLGLGQRRPAGGVRGAHGHHARRRCSTSRAVSARIVPSRPCSSAARPVRSWDPIT